MILIDDMEKIASKTRRDHVQTPRKELHAHTKMSRMDSVCDVKDLIERASQWGHHAEAISEVSYG